MTDQDSYCTYCGRPTPETVDHIPPACLFPSPRPSDLITVPSCSGCNEGASKDDEYFKNWLVLRQDISEHAAGSKLLDSVFRAFAKPQKRGMLNTLVRTMRHVPIFSPAGLYVGHAPVYDVNLERLGRVTNRIVKGLFFKEFRQRLPDNYGVRSFAESGLRDLRSDNRVLLTRVAKAVSATPRRAIGDRVFEYWFQASPEDANTTAWLFRFFEAESFFCVTAMDPIQSPT